LYGKGSPDYGERIQENMIHMLENFSSPNEPVHPIGGQMWFDRSATPAQLRVFNDIRFEIFDDTTPGHSIDWLALLPETPEEEAEMLATFVSGYRVRLYNSASSESEEYLITTGANNTDMPGYVVFQVLPMPGSSRATGDWYVGGWEYVLQNNGQLYKDLDAGTWAIKNAADPVDPQDLTTMSWVETYVAAEIGASNELGELTDVTITAPTDGDVLLYNSGSGQWENSNGSSAFLLITGGTMQGSINMGGTNTITGLPLVGYPSNNSDAATKAYVDSEISGIVAGTPTELNDLADVDTTGVVADSILIYNGADWIDTTYASSAFLMKSGGTMSGDLTLAGAGHQDAPGLAATENYVNNEVTALDVSLTAYVDAQVAAVPGPDGVVTGGSFNPLTQTLTLLRETGPFTGSPPAGTPIDPVTITGITSGGTTTDLITHEIADPNTGIPDWSGSLAMEEWFYKDASYPDASLETILYQLNLGLGQTAAPKRRLVFTANGSSTIYLGDSSGGAIPNQMNPIGDLTTEYVFYDVGQNNLNVYVNGIKQIASEAGYRKLVGNAGFLMTKGTRTGLGAGPYTFDITVDGGTTVTISVSGTTTIGELADAINAVADTNYWQSGTPNSNYAFGCGVYDGAIVFYSGNPGTGSSITLADGASSPLFANIVGDAGSTGAFTVSIGGSNVYAPATYGYTEVGRHGDGSDTIVLTPAPPSGAVVEIVVDHKMFAG
jgi:hypothetical protein